MRFGNKLNWILTFFLLFGTLNSEEKTINLNELQPSYDVDDNIDNNQQDKKTFIFKEIQKNQNSINNQDNIKNIEINFLDKITAKQEKYVFKLNNLTKIKNLEIISKDCRVDYANLEEHFVAYIQILDNSVTGEDKIFIYNGWMFSADKTNYSIEHPLYDIWLSKCN